ncbi:outer membrane beta-barrel protein [Bdellovibrio sp. SKB1291214]|uniref:outer membrane beta-barrel protein n=1 Tax=Bdellovibrio sp. SKB1291214 TaxID=1732569 RepID=UPI00224030D1|nr:outer membrane beta-barrel protein [Bdellovibrio sp. SKB1291214]UYL08945.1 outer membrane beta-barrel protein [Bdellovibrio sp. SKB1291214]
MKTTTAFLTAICLSLPFAASAEEVLSGITAQGEADFEYNFLSAGNNAYPASAGALDEQFRFNSAQIILKKETQELSFFARLMYMPIEVTTPSGTAKNSFGTLDQLEVYYKIDPSWSIGFGRLCSTLGFESAMKVENVLYGNTVAYQSIVPGYNEGARLKFNPGEWLAVTLSTYNRSAYNLYGDDMASTKTTELSATGVSGRFLWFAGHYTGKDASTIIPGTTIEKSTSNIWLTYKFSDDFAWSVSYDSRTQTPEGDTLHYAQSVSSQLSSVMGKHTLGVRYENILGAGELDALNGTTGAYYSGADKVEVWTVGDKYSLSEHLKVYLEFRQDQADQNVLKDANGTLTNHSHMITLGAIAHF